jgi:hypothetical protein
VRRLYSPNHSSGCGQDDCCRMSRLPVLVRRARMSSHWWNSVGRRPNLAATWALGKIRWCSTTQTSELCRRPVLNKYIARTQEMPGLIVSY